MSGHHSTVHPSNVDPQFRNILEYTEYGEGVQPELRDEPLLMKNGF